MMKSLRCRPRILCVHHVTVTRPHSVSSAGWCPSDSASAPTSLVKARAAAKFLNAKARASRFSPSTSNKRQSGTCGCSSAASASVTVGESLRPASHFISVSLDIYASVGCAYPWPSVMAGSLGYNSLHRARPAPLPGTFLTRRLLPPPVQRRFTMSLPSAQKRVVPSVAWQELVAKYQNPELHRSLWQMVNSIAPFLALWYLMYRSLEVSYWLTLALAIPTSGFLMRIFIILHDCGHGSFFKSTAANDLVGSVCGVLTFTPYLQWRHSHAIHHATASDLDRRGTGDVLTITVSEYRALPWYKRLGYRAYRSWLVMFVLAPAFIFQI